MESTKTKKNKLAKLPGEKNRSLMIPHIEAFGVQLWRAKKEGELLPMLYAEHNGKMVLIAQRHQVEAALEHKTENFNAESLRNHMEKNYKLLIKTEGAQ